VSDLNLGVIGNSHIAALIDRRAPPGLVLHAAAGWRSGFLQPASERCGGA